MSAPDDPLAGLKDFQRRTVEHVCRRMLDEGTRRYLVADEVGLGKTLVARGVVAETVSRLRAEGVKRVDVVYVCSNQEIARQNLDRLKSASDGSHALPSRITLLPLHLGAFHEDGVNFVSFTPGTSFDPKSRGGWARERALLLRMLTEPWSLPRHKGVFEVFRVGAHRNTIKDELAKLPTPHDGIQRAFAEKMADSPLREQLHALIEAARRRRLHADEAHERLEIIGELRRELAKTCVDKLEPDLVILDEFQRFAGLLDGDSDAAELASQLFSFDNGAGEFARVLLLSATPYKSFSQAGEDGGSHHHELTRLLTFLYEDAGRAEAVRHQFRALRQLLLTSSPERDDLVNARKELEASLSEVMVRTERLASSATRNGMLVERRANDMQLTEGDVREWSGLATLHRELRTAGYLTSSAEVTEYWKSAPWLAQFMDGYAFKRAVDDAVAERNLLTPELREALARVRRQLDWRGFARYADLAPGNARLRSLRAQTVDEAWRLLWVPASLPYYEPGPPFDAPGAARFTKRLVFSSWAVVPRAISGYLSYEAERRAQRDADATARNTETDRRKHERRLLDFKLDKSTGSARPGSMTALALLAPSPTLAAIGDPRSAARELGGPTRPTLTEIRAQVRQQLASRLDALRPELDQERQGPDQRWYWAAPLLLDRAAGAASEFWGKQHLAHDWTEPHTASIDNVRQHVEDAQAVYADGMALGRRPDDLSEVLTNLALAGPGVVAYRALTGVLADAGDDRLLLAAARVAWGMRQVLNGPEAIAVISAIGVEEPYWQQVLDYCASGNLQAVNDEWVHVLAEDSGLGRGAAEVVVDKVVERMLMALGLGTSRVEVDRLNGTKKVAWRTHFAVRYGQAKASESSDTIHPAAVRQAFNSPFRPFVLASTSVGQEGLDFHSYCHAITHWNLPSNPVDLEQREGRIHRYKGHAVRRNVAEAFGQIALATATADNDPWTAAFDAARAARPADQDDLVPYWLQTGSSAIERHVPLLPLSKDAERYARVLRQVTLYRMVFGQPRQDDLIAYLQAEVGDEQAARIADLVRIDLAPR